MSRNARLPIRSVAVLGAGITGLSAALAFAKALPATRITLVATPRDPSALADRLPGTLASAGEYLALIGVEEDLLVARGAATHRIAQRFDGWRADGDDWAYGSGETGAPIAGTAFHQHWLAARRERTVPPFHRYAPAAVLGAADRFVHPVDDAASPLSRFDYALRLDPERAPAVLAEVARRRGVTIVAGSILAATRRSDGHIDAVQIEQGRTVSADLIIDCTGASSGWAGDMAIEDWGDALPCDRLLLATSPSPAPSPCDIYTATDAGWRAVWPLRDRALRGLAYASSITTDARARRMFGTGGDSAELLAFRPGRQCISWQGNVLAIGDAAACAGPLGWPGLGMATADLALALELLPGRDFHAVELAEYNRRAGLRADRVRDFLALHYLASGRRRGDFWRAMEHRARPPGLALTLQQFARRGTLPQFEEESFDRESWLAVLLGLDITPERLDPGMMAANPAAIAASMAQMEAAVAALPASLPAYPDYLARIGTPA